MASVGGASRNWLLDFYIVGFFLDQAMGLVTGPLLLRDRDVSLLMMVTQFFSASVALFAALLAREVLSSGLDKRLLLLPAWHLGGMAALSVLWWLHYPLVREGGITTVGNPLVIWAGVVQSAIGLIVGPFWVRWARRDAGALRLKASPSQAKPDRIPASPVSTQRPSGAGPRLARSAPATVAAGPGASATAREPRVQTIPRVASVSRAAQSGPPTMAPGAIKAAVEANDGGALFLARAGLVLALLILGLNWKYFYNVARGPQIITGALLQAPGATRAVRSEAPALLAIEETSSSSVRVGRRRGLRRIGVPLPDTKTFFYVGRIDEQWVLVKSNEEASMIVGFSGELFEAPETIVAELKKAGDWGDIQWMVDVNSNHRIPGFWSSVGLLLLVWASYKAVTISLRIRKGYAQSVNLAHLRTLGPIPAVVQRIEREINGFGSTAKIGRCWVTPQWIVTLDPEILVAPSGSVVAAAPIADVDSKTNELKRAGIGLWTKSCARRTALWIEPKEILPLAQAIVERMPWAWVEEAGPFEDRWKGDREGCIREAEGRWRAHQRAVASAAASQTAPSPALAE